MSIKEGSGYVLNARAVALVGIMAATLECGKLVLSFIPNVEVVTLLVALYGYVFGGLGIIAAAVFVCIEPLIWGFGPWLVTYIIYWPMVAFVFMLLRRRGVTSRLGLTACAVGMTLLFGILSSIIDTAFYLGINEYYLHNLLLYYARGIVFYVVQVVTNGVLFPTVFKFLSDKLELVKTSFGL